MKKSVLAGMIGVGLLLAASAHADDYIYKSKNKIDFVKLDKARGTEKDGGFKHPYEFTDDQLRAIFSSLHFNKKILLLKDIENRDLFAPENVEFLTTYLKDAFHKAKDNQVVLVSYFTRDSHVVIQNDRLTIFRAFVKDDGLHLKFTKLYAKMLGDRTTQGSTVATNQARGMRVSLELQPGQNRVSWDPEELVLDLNQIGASASGGSVAAKKDDKPSKKDKKGKVQKEEAAEQTPPKEEKSQIVRKTKTAKETDSAAESKAQDVRDRLKQLDQLKKDAVISDKEYQEKRKEILKDL